MTATTATAARAADLFEALSRLRGKRAFHPFGAGFAASFVPAPNRGIGAPALEGERGAVVRLSRSLGLPEQVPDPCGVALRLPDAHGEGRHQDFLFASSGRAPL